MVLPGRFVEGDAGQQACVDCAFDAFDVAVVELHAAPGSAECGAELAGGYLSAGNARHAANSLITMSSSTQRTPSVSASDSYT